MQGDFLQKDLRQKNAGNLFLVPIFLPQVFLQPFSTAVLHFLKK